MPDAKGPERLVLTRPGDQRVLRALEARAADSDVPLELREDRHFYRTPTEFAAWAEGRKRLVLEDFYRCVRREQGILLTAGGGPVGGAWNYDAENREAFGQGGPGAVKAPRSFRPDATTEDVLDLVRQRFSDHPGRLEGFDLPVRRDQARALLRDFVEHRLPRFGRFQDAMWTGEDFLHHSRLSFALNLKLLSPRECVEAALDAHESGEAPLASVEGFVRQLVGWREFVRGIYWLRMPEYAEGNALGCDDRDVPPFFWDGETDMVCVREGMRNVIEHAYAHHIQRLMVLGLFALLLGVHPRRFHDWHMAMYADAVDWVSLPNTLGMSQYGDGGVVGTKPYGASGAYVDRMSDYCGGCRYDPKRARGDEACPFTTLYWDFLARHRNRLAGNRRMRFQLRNLERKSAQERKEIRNAAAALKGRVTRGLRI